MIALKNMENNTPNPVKLSSTDSVDTHNYKGWLNSDNFWKRAFAVYGYSFVASMVVAIPVLVVLFVISLFVGFALFNSTRSGISGTIRFPSTAGGELRINTDQVCEDSLAYTDFTDATSAQKYVDSCKRGEHPEVIERYRASLNSGSVI